MERNRILIIEDEKELAQILSDYLEVEGFESSIATDGEMGLTMFAEYNPDLIILDIMLPRLDGIEVCKRIRQSSDVPILILSAKNGEMDKVISLGIGADDYVTKPFSAFELIARVKAHLRRYQKNATQESTNSSLQIGELMMNKESYEVSVAGKHIDMTTKEFEVLYFLASNENQVFTKEQIYDQIWGMNVYGDISSVAVYIKRIRRKLEQFEIDYIRTVWGVGYKFAIS